MKKKENDDYILRVALFGAGKMATNHANAIKLIKNANLVAIADPEKSLCEVKKVFGKEVEWFQSGWDLLQKEKPDVVHICAPPSAHAELASQALQGGAHIYVEKPFVLKAVDAVEIFTLSKEVGRKVCVGHQLLYERPTIEARNNIEKIGRIVFVESYFSFRPVRRPPDGRRVMPPIEQLLDILPHPVYLLLHFLRMGATQKRLDPVEMRGLEVRTRGSVHGILECGGVIGSLVVTLEGRPVESYVKIVGTNGSLVADFVRGITVALPGPGTSGISKAINPYSQSWQVVAKTTGALARRALRKQRSYPGLLEIIGAFYQSIEKNESVVPDGRSIIETVRVCETIGEKLRRLKAEENRSAEAELIEAESRIPLPETGRDHVLVTGGAGLLGKAVASELRQHGWPTRVVSRQIPAASEKIPGVEYIEGDLGDTVAQAVLNNIAIVIHCAAETAGGLEAHARNSVGATRNLISAMNDAGVKRLVHISSIAVLQSSRETGRAVDENTPLVRYSETRGPYVWGKAESEILAIDLCERYGIELRVLRPGPLVDFHAFVAPGRLGREAGPFFVAVGPRKNRMNLCEVHTAAVVIAYYVANFDDTPPVLNLLEPDSLTREDLVCRLKADRPDLKVIRIPTPVLWAGARLAVAAQRILRPSKAPVDVYRAFASERYSTDLAAEVIRKAKRRTGDNA